VVNASDSRVFLLTGAAASRPGTIHLLAHFLAHYVDTGGIPREYVLVVVHTRGGEDVAATREIVDLLNARGIFHEVWVGEALLFSTVAHHWEHHLANAANDNDWVVVADLDEHLQLTPGQTVPAFLGKVDQMGYSLVHGTWVDRMADRGQLGVSFGASSLARTFPLQCTIGGCNVGGARARGNSGQDLREGGRSRVYRGINTYALHGLHHYSSQVGVVGDGQRIFAHKAQYPILDVRTLQDFGLDDVVTASRLVEDHDAAYPVPLKVNHYQWHAGTAAELGESARKYAACNLLDQEESVLALLDRLRDNDLTMSPGVCSEIVCYRAGGGSDAAVHARTPYGQTVRGVEAESGGEGTNEYAGSEGESHSDSIGGNEGGDVSFAAADAAAGNARAAVMATATQQEQGVDTQGGTLGAISQQRLRGLPESYGHGAGLGAIPAVPVYGAERRVMIFATVWEHVDGVSRTMKRLANHLKERSDSAVFVMSPDLVEADYRDAAASPRYHVAPMP